jgi:starch-binding outer membrane protein, SusD/RagB family
MKKIQFIYSLALATLFVLGSCADRLEISPVNSIDATLSLSTSKDVEAYLIGCYDGLQGTNANGDTYGGGFQYTSELLGDAGEIRFGGSFSNLLDLWNKAITTNNTTAETQWTRSYNTINRCNTVLDALDTIVATKRVRVEAEALFIRSILYFELVRFYGKQWDDGDNATNPGVPLVFKSTKVFNDAKDALPRSSVAQVYAQVITDLTKAEANLPVSNGAYATKGAAAAFLARVYLQQGKYTEAAAAANRVIASSRYSLPSTFAGSYNTKLTNSGNNPSDYVFATQVNDQDGFNGMNTFFGVTINSIPGSAGRGDMRILGAHTALYDSIDVRGKYFIRTSSTSTRLYTQKFLDRFGHVPVIRLSEMYLTRAEANFRQSTTVGATPLADINRTRTRAGLPALATVTLADILKERRLELAFEGFRLHDVKRTKASVGTLAWNSDKLVLPVPQREIDVNKSLKQNPGY